MSNPDDPSQQPRKFSDYRHPDRVNNPAIPSKKVGEQFSLPDLIIRSPRDYALMLRERWPWGLALAMIAAGVIIFLEARKPEMYYTEASLEFEELPTNILPDAAPVMQEGGAAQVFTHMERIKSLQYINYLLNFFTERDEEILQRPYRLEDPTAEPPPLQTMIGPPNLDVRIRRDAPIVQIGIRHRGPEAAALIADRFAIKYIDWNVDRAQTATNAAIISLQKEQDRMRDEFEARQAAMQDFRERHNMLSLGDTINVINQRVTRLSDALIAAEQELLNSESLLQKVEVYEANGADLLDIQQIADFGTIPAQVMQMEDLKSQRALLSIKYLERHPKMVANAEAMIAIKDLLSENIREAVENLETQGKLLVEHKDRLRVELQLAETEQLKLQKVESEFEILNQRVQLAEDNLTRVSKRLKDAQLSAQLSNTMVKKFDPAWTPNSPVQPDIKKAVIWSAFAAILLFFGVPIGVGLLDYRLKAQWEVEEFLETNLLGEIPKFKGVSKMERPHMVGKALKHGPCEAFRGLYSRMELSTTVGFPKSILITSTIPNDCKSIISHNLAETFAAHGRKTLLLDADFRNPTLQKFQGLKNEAGILRWLKEGDDHLDDPINNPELGIVQVSENFSFLRSGGNDRRPTEFFNSARLQYLLDVLHSHYDLIIVDTPPVGVFSDALLLSKLVDEVVFVCRFRKVNKFKVRHFVEKIGEAGIPLNGIVLNGIPPGRVSAFYGYYGYGANESSEYEKYYEKKS